MPHTDAAPLLALSRTALFAGLPPAVLSSIAEHAQLRRFPAHEIILQQGQHGHSLFVIDDGMVEIVYNWQVQRGHGEVVIGTLGPGAIFGELGVITDYPRAASVVALEPLVCYEIPRTTVTLLLEQHPEFLRALMRLLADRLQQADSRVAQETANPLTGLPNRGILGNAFKRAAGALQRDGGALALVMLDVDRLKSINDQFGHQAGDQALQVVGAALERTLRRMDLAVRYGGDEFLAMLLGANEDAAHTVMARVRAGLGAAMVAPVSIEFSYGIAAVRCAPGDPVGTLEELIDQADQALYRQKQRSLGPS